MKNKWENREKRKVEVNTLSDIQNAIKPFMPNASAPSEVELEAEIEYKNDNNESEKVLVSAGSRGLTLRKILIDGLDLVKTRLDLAEKMKNEVIEDEDDDLLPERIKWNLYDVDSNFFHVDTLIKQELDGKRKGLRVRWNVPDGTYEFDPYDGKLFKVDDNVE